MPPGVLFTRKHAANPEVLLDPGGEEGDVVVRVSPLHSHNLRDTRLAEHPGVYGVHLHGVGQKPRVMVLFHCEPEVWFRNKKKYVLSSE